MGRFASLSSKCRDLTGVRGFTRQILIGVVTTIESREQKRLWNASNGIPPENPRASTTDDVECFFSTMRDAVGKNFTLKQVKPEMRKICKEFAKRQDSKLPFFYFTSAHGRFSEGERPNFNRGKEGKRNPRQMHPRRRELAGGLAPSRVTLAVHGSVSKRMQFHNIPVNLPPPPGTPAIHSFEHSYSK